MESSFKAEALGKFYEDLRVEKELLPADQIETPKFFIGLFYGTPLSLILWCVIILIIKLIASI